MSRPNLSLRTASSDLSDLNPKWVQRPTTRAKGWMVRRGKLPIYPNIYSLNYPGAFNKHLSLKLLVLTTKIPVACVGVLSIFGPCPPIFPRALARFRGWDAWLPLAGTLLCRFSGYSTPGHHTASEPTSSLNWRVPSLATPPQCPRGVLAPRVHFRGSPVPNTLPPWHTAPRAPQQRVTRAHYTIPAPHGPLAYRGRLARCPGYPLSDTHRS